MASKTTYMLEVMLGASTSSSYYRNLNNAANGLQSLNRTASLVAGAITTAFAAINITRAIQDAVETYSEFEQEMATVSSIANATTSQYEMLEEAALSAGRSTIYTATESASALEYMSLAGWDVETSIAGLTPVLRMAAATGKELGTTSDLVTDSMGAMQMGVDELGTYLDKMIAANNNANTTAEELMQAMIKVGGTSRTVGADLDDTATALGIIANNGTKAEESGTALNAILTRLTSNGTALSELDVIGVSIFNEEGKFIGLEESLRAINEATKDFSQERMTQTLTNLAGGRRNSIFQYLLDAVKESADTGIDAWDRLEEKVANSTGALSRMYDTTTDTLQNAQAIWTSAKDDMKIRLVDVFSDDAKEFIFWMADRLPEATDSLVAFAEAHRGDFADALETAGEAIESVWDTGVAVGTWIINHKGAVVGSITAIGTALVGLKTASTVASLAEFFTGMASNPLGLFITACAAATGAVVGISAAIEQAEEKAIQANLADHFGDISLSLEELDTLARKIVGEDSLNGIAAMLEAAEQTSESLGNVTKIWSELQKEDWKINLGFDFDKEDSEAYASKLERYISGVEQYATDKGYEVHIAATVLFGEGSQQDIEASQFYQSVQEELKQCGADLSQYLTKAMEDGIIIWDEEQYIQTLLEKVNTITSAISEAESQAKFDALALKYNGADLNAETFMQLQEDIGDYVSEAAEGAQSAYESAMAGYRLRLNMDDTYTQEMFDADSQNALAAYYEVQGEAAVNGLNYMMDTINTAYPEMQRHLNQYQEDLAKILRAYSDSDDIDLQNDWETNPYLVIRNMEAEAYAKVKDNLIDEDRGALAELLGQMAPTVQQLQPIIQGLTEAGEELPEDIARFKDTYHLLYNLVNEDQEGVAVDLANAMSADDAFSGFLDDIGYEIDETYMTVQQKIDEAYQDGFDVSADLRVDLEVSESGLDAGISSAGKKMYNRSIYGAYTENSTLPTKKLHILSNAEGGIYTRPILTTFAENGPETAQPLDGSDRAKALWLKSGEILGMIPGGMTRDKAMYNAISSTASGGSSAADKIQIIYNPSIVIQGNAPEEAVQRAVSMGIDELREMLEEIVAEKQRVSFG